MNRPMLDSRAASLRAYPNIRTAAAILDVAASTLSRREDLLTERRGERDRVLSAAEVLRLAAIYRKRSVNDVAQDLVDHARTQSTADEAQRVAEEAEEFFERRMVSGEDRDEFLARARQLLPAPLYKDVEAVVSTRGKSLPEGLLGYPPVPRDN